MTVDDTTTDPTRRGTLVVEIRAAGPDELRHRLPTAAAARLTWAVDWPTPTTVRLRSSDTGTAC